MSDFTKWVEAWDAYRNAGLPVQGSIANCLCLLGIIGIAVSIPLALSHFAYPKFGTHTVISIVSFMIFWRGYPTSCGCGGIAFLFSIVCYTYSSY